MSVCGEKRGVTIETGFFAGIYKALHLEYKADWIGYRARLTKCRALLTKCRALLTKCRARFLETLISATIEFTLEKNRVTE